jgi:hypothetical protein
MPGYRTPLLAALIAAAALALPGVAGAATFCVQAPDCPAGGISTGADLQAALSAAGSQAGTPNTILVGDKGSPYRGPFTYQPLAVVPRPLTITADGGRPVLTADAGDTVLTMTAATLDGIDVSLPTAAEGEGIDMQDSTLHDVSVSSQLPGPGAIGVAASGLSALDQVRITASGDGGLVVRGVDVAGLTARVKAQHLQVSGPLVAVDVNDASTVTLTQSQLTGKAFGLNTAGSAELIRDTVATTDAGSIGVSESDGSLGIDHVTIAHEGPQAGSDTALALHAANLNPFVTLEDSALAGYSHGITRAVSGGHLISFTALNSVWNPAGDQLGPASAGSVHEAADLPAEPALVNLPGGDLRPRGSSAQIDLDTTSDPTTYTDLAGTPAIDGNGDGIVRADAGAFEYRRQVPTVDAINAPAAGVAGAQLPFNAVVSDADGDQVTARWDFGDGTGATGTSAGHVYTAPGTYQGTLTAANESGLTVRRAFTITVSAAAPTPSGTTAGGSPGATPPPPSAPALSGLRLSSTRVSVRRAGSLRLRFTANETVTIRILTTRRGAARAVLQRAVVRQVSAGNDSIALASALRKLHLLKPGRLTLTVTANDASGARTNPQALQLTLVR